MKFSEAVGVPREEDYILGPIAPIIPRRVNNVKNGGLEEVYTITLS